MMTTNETALDRYTNELEIALRLRGATGPRMGEVLAEVEAHVAESGEDPVAAFGSAREYARAVVPSGKGFDGGGLLRAGGGALAGFLLSNGVVGLLRGEAGVVGIPAWLCLAVAVVMFAVFTALTPVNAVVDPRNGRTRGPGRRAFAVGILVFAVVLVVATVGVELALR